ncbi:hypothetical protein LCGC14_1496250 [marine sediment metagenome]|uniref:Uncharacterized protein n=1 Tax=marine sediment metagenome TaxID=412755 RepID=A0A0F9M6X3_9ZZZZ|nr:hypothetical protein [Pricia sp.]
MKKDTIYLLIIIFLLGMIFSDVSHSLKIPDIDLVGITPELKEVMEDYIFRIINNGLYQLKINTSEVSSTTTLPRAVLQADFSSVNKYLVIQVGDVNYRVEVTAIP